MVDDLLTLRREHDLPPRWDGRPVTWSGWDTGPTGFICPPPKNECCHACGSHAPTVFNHGYVAISHLITDEEITAAQAARDLLPPGLRHKIDSLVRLELTAYRCPDCNTDLVEDQVTGLWWELDHTDYGPDGSNPPATTNAGLR